MTKIEACALRNMININLAFSFSYSVCALILHLAWLFWRHFSYIKLWLLYFIYIKFVIWCRIMIIIIVLAESPLQFILSSFSALSSLLHCNSSDAYRSNRFQKLIPFANWAATTTKIPNPAKANAIRLHNSPL